ncbi:MAG: hypothetical protein E6K80_14875 [Candidatus Eisenbacteria bacterium]|uniref:Uncharacterized protein n=1 Tax=Eiseniibacteriota bacterium TaxID=2212470 RepID=A0A538TW75_UNCEI|nr:MAG: hypothetical protein E6K80_14875 [Candidatus Eisenbacteria bacterium]
MTITNESRSPLRVRYGDFTLTGSGGFRSAAIPPYRIRGSATTDLADRVDLTPRFAYDRFDLAPAYWGYYPGLRHWGYAWTSDPFYYDHYYSLWQEPLPSNDMVEQALPEGVLEPGGRVTGFLYFQRLGSDVTGATFRATLVDANSSRSFGSLRVPFVMR